MRRLIRVKSRHSVLTVSEGAATAGARRATLREARTVEKPRLEAPAAAAEAMALRAMEREADMVKAGGMMVVGVRKSEFE
jgi:hypothetical protein